MGTDGRLHTNGAAAAALGARLRRRRHGRTKRAPKPPFKKEHEGQTGGPSPVTRRTRKDQRARATWRPGKTYTCAVAMGRLLRLGSLRSARGSPTSLWTLKTWAGSGNAPRRTPGVCVPLGARPSPGVSTAPREHARGASLACSLRLSAIPGSWSVMATDPVSPQ